MAVVSKDVSVEDLVRSCPDAVGYLIEQGLPCVVCGEPFWGTLGELARLQGWAEDKIDALAAGLSAKCA